jgi:hypothetical protein
MKTQVDIINELAMLKMKEIAIKNGLKTTRPDLINLALDIAFNSFQYLDKESFENVTNLEI